MLNPENKTIVFLYTRLADYFYQCVINFLKNNSNIEAIIIRYQPDVNAPFQFQSKERLQLINKGEFSNNQQLISYITQLQPSAIYSSGWSDSGYVDVARHFYGKIPTILGLDNPWEGRLRQKGGVFYNRVFRNRVFSHVWTAGKPQYEYARRLGYSYNKILNELYSANSGLFENAYNNSIEKKKTDYPKKLLFIGRYVNYKQPLLLLKLFSELQTSKQTNGWSLELVGSGPLLDKLKEYEDDNIKINPFAAPQDLPAIMSNCGAFCLPSRSEHWGVVVHEAAASGLPLLLSKTTYAGTEFLINKFNGFLFIEDDPADFKANLIALFKKSEEELLVMAERSNFLSKKISQNGWEANLLSVL